MTDWTLKQTVDNAALRLGRMMSTGYQQNHADLETGFANVCKELERIGDILCDIKDIMHDAVDEAENLDQCDQCGDTGVIAEGTYQQEPCGCGAGK